jgi:general secretion pathway protein C
MIRRYFFIINLLLIAAAVYYGIRTFYTLTTGPLYRVHRTGPISKKVSLPEEEVARPLSYYQPISERNLFKVQESGDKAASKPKAIDVESLKQTELKLKLWGTVTGNPETDYAVIEEGTAKEQNLYRVGDSIQNATVKMILREKVVLSVDGKDEVLKMEEVADDKKTLRRPLARPSFDRTAPIAPVRSQKIRLRRSQIESMVAGPSDLTSQVTIQPYLEEGSPDGVLLTGIKPNSIFRRLGLRNGDVIKEINGEPVLSADGALSFYETLKSSSKASIQIKRRGRTRNIDYTVE